MKNIILFILWRAEVGEGPHKHQQGGGQDGGHGQGHDNPFKAVHPLAAHALGGLQQGVVNIPKGAVHINDHQRKELQCLNKDDTAEAI